MNTGYQRAKPRFAGVGWLCFCAVVCVPVTAQNRAPNPTSKFFVASLEGESAIDTGERIEDLSERSVHNAQGTVIETLPSASNAMVFSNGTGVFLQADTRVEVRRFQQEPFLPNRTDLETEPSISQMHMFVNRGAVGVCPARQVPGSSMVYSTALGSISVRSGQLVVESDDYETRFSLLQGDVTVREGVQDRGGTALQPGQQAVIRRLPGQEPEFIIRPIPGELRPQIEEKAAQACMARRTVYFDVNDRAEEGDDTGPEVFFREDGPGDESDNTTDNLIVIELIPTDPPAPPLSASRITGP
jgi:hypothetical protein